MTTMTRQSFMMKFFKKELRSRRQKEFVTAVLFIFSFQKSGGFVFQKEGQLHRSGWPMGLGFNSSPALHQMAERAFQGVVPEARLKRARLRSTCRENLLRRFVRRQDGIVQDNDE